MINLSLLNTFNLALEEDKIEDDVTTVLLGTERDKKVSARIVAKQDGVFCGEALCPLFQEISAKARLADGATFKRGDALVELHGSVGKILTLERTLLNFLCHLTGIATHTRQFVDLAKPHRAQIIATRKTLPGLRAIQLMAVKAGGGKTHRRSLSDGILIKENHLRILSESEALTRARAMRSPLHRIEFEVQSLEMLPKVLPFRPDLILLDNLAPDEVSLAVREIDGKVETEVSGNVNLQTVATYAATGVDYISVGKLTHSSAYADLSLDIQ